MLFNILIVDDEIHVLETMAFLLQERTEVECQIYTATSGEEALSIAEDVTVHLLLTDVRMPNMTGLELYQKLLETQPDCKAIILTGFTDFESVYSAVQMNVAGYLLKTEDDDKIIDTLNNFLCILQEQYPDEPVPQVPEGADMTVSFLKKYIQEHLSEDVSLGRLAEVSGYNADYLSRLFKQQTGTTIRTYISEKRAIYVKKLLRDEKLSLEEISNLAGFSSRSYFNRFVRLITGMSPRQYRIFLKINAEEG